MSTTTKTPRVFVSPKQAAEMFGYERDRYKGVYEFLEREGVTKYKAPNTGRVMYALDELEQLQAASAPGAAPETADHDPPSRFRRAS